MVRLSNYFELDSKKKKKNQSNHSPTTFPWLHGGCGPIFPLVCLRNMSDFD